MFIIFLFNEFENAWLGQTYISLDKNDRMTVHLYIVFYFISTAFYFHFC